MSEPKVGDKAPAFSLKSTSGDMVSLDQFKGSKNGRLLKNPGVLYEEPYLLGEKPGRVNERRRSGSGTDVQLHLGGATSADGAPDASDPRDGGRGTEERCRLSLIGCTRRWVGRRFRRSSLLRALLLQMLYTIRSERLLMEQLDYNLSVSLVCRARHGRSGVGRDDLHQESRSPAGW